MSEQRDDESGERADVAGDEIAADRDAAAGDEPSMDAARYPDGTVLYPPHPLGPDGSEPVGTVDLSEYTATVITWTSSTATPPGVRQPNHLAIVEFDLGGTSGEINGTSGDTDGAAGSDSAGSTAAAGTVRAIGQLTTDAVEIGDRVEPVYVSTLREPGAGIREPASQSWDGYRFRPVE